MSIEERLGGVVLAAGRSERMAGVPKVCRPVVADMPAVIQVTEALLVGGIAPVVIIVQDDSSPVCVLKDWHALREMHRQDHIQFLNQVKAGTGGAAEAGCECLLRYWTIERAIVTVADRVLPPAFVELAVRVATREQMGENIMFTSVKGGNRVASKDGRAVAVAEDRDGETLPDGVEDGGSNMSFYVANTARFLEAASRVTARECGELYITDVMCALRPIITLLDEDVAPRFNTAAEYEAIRRQFSGLVETSAN